MTCHSSGNWGKHCKTNIQHPMWAVKGRRLSGVVQKLAVITPWGGCRKIHDLRGILQHRARHVVISTFSSLYGILYIFISPNIGSKHNRFLCTVVYCMKRHEKADMGRSWLRVAAFQLDLTWQPLLAGSATVIIDPWRPANIRCHTVACTCLPIWVWLFTALYVVMVTVMRVYDLTLKRGSFLHYCPRCSMENCALQVERKNDVMIVNVTPVQWPELSWWGGSMDVGDVTDPNLDGDFRALLEARQVLLDVCCLL